MGLRLWVRLKRKGIAEKPWPQQNAAFLDLPVRGVPDLRIISRLQVYGSGRKPLQSAYKIS